MEVALSPQGEGWVRAENRTKISCATQVLYGFLPVFHPKNAISSHQIIRPRCDAFWRSFCIDPPIHLDHQIRIPLPGFPYFFEYRIDEFLTTKTRMYRHHQEQIHL